MASHSLSPDDVKRVKGLGFLNNRGTDRFSARVLTVNGMVTASQTRCLAEAAETFGNGRITFTTRQTVEVQGIPFDNIEAFRSFIAQAGLETGGTGPKVRPVVACKGTTCQYGLIDTFDLSRKIHERFYQGYHQVVLPHKFKIAVGGCPNNCVKPDLNDLGIIGQRKPAFDETACKGCAKCAVEAACPVHAAHVRDGLLQTDPDVCNNCGRCIGKCPFHAVASGTAGYKIYIGGRWGKQVARGRPLKKIFATETEALDLIENAILLFREEGTKGERFATVIERLGFDSVQERLLSGESLSRKAGILAADLK